MKKSDRFHDLSEIFHCLSKPEREILLMQTKEFENKSIRGYEHCHRIVQSLADPQQYDQQKVLDDLQNNASHQTEVSQVFLLTKGLLLEQLQLEASIERPGVYSNQFRTRVTTSKKIHQARILLARGVEKHAVRLLEECVSKARKYELFEIELEALEILQMVESSAKGTRTFNRFETYIKEAEHNRYLTRVTRHELVKYRIQEERRSEEDRAEWLEQTLAGLEKKLGKQALGFPSYVLATFKTELALVRSDFRKAEREGQKLTDLIAVTPAIQSQERETHANLLLAQARIHLRKFTAASQVLEEAEKKVKKNSVEAYFIRQYGTYILFYTKDMQRLQTWLPAAIKSKYTERRPYAKAQFRFFQSVYDFLAGHFAASAKSLASVLDEPGELSIEGRFGHGLLLVMAAIEQSAEKDYTPNDHLKKAMDEMALLDNEAMLNKRYKTIFRILRRLEGQEWDFKKTAPLVKGSLSRLSSGPVEVSWKPLTLEIIPFHLWFEAKVSSKAFKFKLPAATAAKAGQ